MKKFSFTAGSLVVFLLVAAGFAGADGRTAQPPAGGATVAYDIDRAHSNIGFKVRHLGIASVSGSFGEYDVALTFDPADLSTLRASARIAAASINTQNSRRDDHLRAADFFDVEQYPELTFVSKRVQNIEGSRFQLVGDLTIKDVTKEVVLDAELVGTATGPRGEPRAALEASTTINRLDYNLTWNSLTEAGGVIVSPEVKIILEIAAFQQ